MYTNQIADLENFNPLPPWGGRPLFNGHGCDYVLRFQSTPSVGRETFGHFFDVQIPKISIHSLRGEGDPRRAAMRGELLYFNPLPPWGGRQDNNNNNNNGK